MNDHLADLSSYFDQNTNQNINQSTNENELSKSTVHKKIFSKSENISTNLSIKTAQGDIVQLSTNSFYDFKSLLYDKKGQVYSDAGLITNRESYRQMTLASGESFTFSVTGHLNAQELDDIETIVQQIDTIISDMKNGDMGNALKKALDMGGYDSISKFSANLSVKKSYSMVTEKIQNRIAEVEEDLIKKARQPISQLVNHHFKELLDKQEKSSNPINVFLEQLQQH
ncbi:MAG: hypothetical protein GY707_04370 [Desulfobacteraceae bacterium]|nr:hypothetical protein [Desulfobacteraceae bacterium]